MRDNLMDGLSSGRFLGVTQTSRKQRYVGKPIYSVGRGDLAYGGKYFYGAATLALFDREYEPGVGLLSYIGTGVCPRHTDKGSVQMIFKNAQDMDFYTRGKLSRENVRPMHAIEFPQRFMQRANAAYLAQNKPNEDAVFYRR